MVRERIIPFTHHYLHYYFSAYLYRYQLDFRRLPIRLILNNYPFNNYSRNNYPLNNYPPNTRMRHPNHRIHHPRRHPQNHRDCHNHPHHNLMCCISLHFCFRIWNHPWKNCQRKNCCRSTCCVFETIAHVIFIIAVPDTKVMQKTV